MYHDHIHLILGTERERSQRAADRFVLLQATRSRRLARRAGRPRPVRRRLALIRNRRTV